MTPAMFDRRMEEVCKLPTRQAVAEQGFALMQEALGANAHSYLPGLDAFCRRLRQLKWRKSYGAPTSQSIAESKREFDVRGEAL